MNLTKITKSLLIALPIFALAACSSTNEEMKSEPTKANMEASANVETNMLDSDMLGNEESMVKMYSDAILQKTIHFDFDKSVIRPEFAMILDAHAKFLVDHKDQTVTIEGHTDEQGTPEYNVALGERRAMSVSTYLENMGVSSSQISVVSYGEEKPVNFSHNVTAWKENRRAVLAY